jgi:hypothetical protein
VDISDVIRALSPGTWFYISRTIRSGGRPTDGELIEALRAHDDAIPPEVRDYLANLLEGKVDRRGRPKVGKYVALNEANFLIFQVRYWETVATRAGRSDAKMAAYAKVAKIRGWRDGEVTRRQYHKARDLVRRETRRPVLP